jgi:hypothetical protein
LFVFLFIGLNAFDALAEAGEELLAKVSRMFERKHLWKLAEALEEYISSG